MRFLAAAVLPLLIAAAPPPSVPQKELTIERVFDSPSLSGAVPRSPKLSPDGRYLAVLRNRPNETKQEFPAKIQVEGDTLGGGHLQILVDDEPLAEKPHFHLSLKVTKVDLTALNDSLKSTANVEVNRGTFEMVMEMAGKDGAFQGYVKPFFNNLDFKTREDKKGSVVAHLWEKIVSGVAWLVKNKPRDQVATRIPFQGEFGDSQVGLGATVRNLFRHGFIKAFNPVVEGSVDPDKVPPPSEIAPKKADRSAQKKAEKNLEQNNDAKSEKLGEPSGK